MFQLNLDGNTEMCDNIALLSRKITDKPSETVQPLSRCKRSNQLTRSQLLVIMVMIIYDTCFKSHVTYCRCFGIYFREYTDN